MAYSGGAGTPIHPLHAILLAFPVALFTGTLASDATYLNTAEIQWTNFAAWLNAGALLFAAPVLIWAGVLAFLHRRDAGRTRAFLYLALLAAMWVLGLINAFQHSRDGWSSVGTLGLILSIACAVLAIAAAWIAHMARGTVVVERAA